MVEKDAHGKLRAKFVPVTTGITGATDIEVLSGLNEGQEIVTGPYKTLRDSERRRAAQAGYVQTGYARRNYVRAASSSTRASLARRLRLLLAARASGHTAAGKG